MRLLLRLLPLIILMEFVLSYRTYAAQHYQKQFSSQAISSLSKQVHIRTMDLPGLIDLFEFFENEEKSEISEEDTIDDVSTPFPNIPFIDSSERFLKAKYINIIFCNPPAHSKEFFYMLYHCWKYHL